MPIRVRCKAAKRSGDASSLWALRVPACIIVLFALTGVSADEAPQLGQTAELAVPSGAESVEAPGFAGLVDRVRSARLDGRPLEFFDPLIIGDFYGGHLLVTAIEMDPLNPGTFELYFEQWNASARAHLLLAYSRAVIAGEVAPRYAGLSAQDAADQQQRDALDRDRILQVAGTGEYAQDWAPFVSAFREFLPRAEAVVRKLKGEQRAPTHMEIFQAVNNVARESGLHALIESTRVRAEDVAAEMLRLVRAAHVNRGMDPDRGEMLQEHLFYSCGAPVVARDTDQPEASRVRVRSWHPLAPAFFRAWTLEAEDPRAGKIMDAFRRLDAQFAEWLEEHGRADSETQDNRLRHLVAALDLIDLLEDYGRSRTFAAESQ